MSFDASTFSSSVTKGMSTLTSNGLGGALKIILFAVILFVICLIVRKVLLRLLEKGLERSNRIEKSLHTFLHSAVNVLLWFITIMIVAQSLGVNATSLITLLGIVGLAVSLAVRDSLANLAGGITILVTKPFKVGDFIDVENVSGTVLEIGMVHTKLNTVDQCRIVLPNSKIVSARVTNYSVEDRRRVDLQISAAYDAPVEKVKRTILEVISRQEEILQDPPPFVRLSQYGESSLEYTVRVWCGNAQYWDVYYDVLEQVKDAFDREGISIPYPHMDVRVLKDQ